MNFGYVRDVARGDGLWSAPAHLVVADPSLLGGGRLARRLVATGHYRVTRFDDPALAAAHARATVADPPLAVLVALRFPEHGGDGLDVLAAFARWCPESALIVRPRDRAERPLLARAWLAHQPLSVVPADEPWESLIRSVDHLARTGATRVDEAWRADLCA